MEENYSKDENQKINDSNHTIVNNERLLNVFNLTNETFNSNKKNKDQKSNQWKEENLIPGYSAKKRIFNIRNLVNFREKNGLNIGINENSFSELNIEIITKFTKALSEEYVLNNMPIKNIGNSPYSLHYKNHYLDLSSLTQLCWLKNLEPMFKEKNRYTPTNFCEIGGGYGNFASMLIRNHGLKFLSIELPEASLMLSYFLKENFPDKKFFLYDDYMKNKFLSLEDFENNDIIILPPNSEIDNKIKIDFFINARSMMEMNTSIVKSYFEFINEYISDQGYFLNINRYEKRILENPIKLWEYPYGEDWKVLVTSSSPAQEHIHFLLTQKTYILNEKNINQALIEIKEAVRKKPSLLGP